MFGPPGGVTHPSSWPWIDRRVSGLRRPTRRPLRTRFRYGFVSLDLTSPAIVTRRLIMQKARNCTLHTLAGAIVLLRLVDTRFQVLFTPLAGVLFAFPSRYWFAIGRQVVFSLGRWSSRVPTGLLEPRGTQVPPRAFSRFTYAAVTRSGRPFQAVRLQVRDLMSAALQPPRSCDLGFGLFRVRSPLLAESLI